MKYIFQDKIIEAEFNGYKQYDYKDRYQHYVALNDSQIEFYQNNPDADVEEIWECELRTRNIRTIGQAIDEKIAQLHAHDTSSAVNDYFVMGVSMASIGMWKDKFERAAIVNGAQSKLRKGIIVMDLPIGNTVIQLPTANYLDMLADLEDYTYECWLQTELHTIAINNFKNAEITIEQIDAYDVTEGYPPIPRYLENNEGGAE